MVAEFLGTAMLVAAVVGSGIMAERLAGGQEALALLANTVATVATLIVAILICGPISGAHFNPAVSLWSGREHWPLVPAQALGGVGGAMLANALFGLPLVYWSTKARGGGLAWASEMVATFVLLLTIRMVGRSRPEATPFAVGLIIAGAYWFTPSTSFANPAVTLARAFSNTYAGIALGDVAGFAAAQIAGAGLAVGLANWLAKEEKQ